MSKRNYNTSKTEKRLKKAKKRTHGSGDDVLLQDVIALRGRLPQFMQTEHSVKTDSATLPDKLSEIEVDIEELSSTGDGIGVSGAFTHVFVVPFAVPGDRVLARVINHFPQAFYFTADFIKLLRPGSQRNEDLIRCKYFARCGGCQLQMLPYDAQLSYKKNVVEKAYKNFSGLIPDVIPSIGHTIDSPLQYGYRTKLTPHFDGPPGSMSRKVRKDPSLRKTLTETPPIGFQEKGRGKTLDIEDCPIGTDILRQGLQTERQRIAREFSIYNKGATILLRENTIRRPRDETDVETAIIQPVSALDGKESGESQSEAGQRDPTEASDLATKAYVEEKVCITDQKATTTEYIDDFVFKNTAGAFFQNNNSILLTFTAYIRNHIVSPTPTSEGINPIRYLIDAYCGSGLFTVTLSSLFERSIGIDIAGASVTAARQNAIANGIDNATFMTADAAELFKEVTFPPAETAVVIDPPRKGCDSAFLQQLLKFGPKR